MGLTKYQWEILEPLIPESKSGDGKRGRPARGTRDVLEGILWVLRTGAPWHDLPSKYPSYQTCHRRFQDWVNEGVLQEILKTLWDDLRNRGGVADVEGFIDGTYVPAKKGGTSSGGAGLVLQQNSWQSQTARVFLSLSLSLPVTKMSVLSSKRLWSQPSLSDSQGNLSETKLMTVLRLYEDFNRTEILN